LIEDVWENFKNDMDNSEIGLDKHVKEKVNEKLQQYLKENSHYLSANVERYMAKVSKGEAISDNERIQQLGLLAYERRYFRERLDVVRSSFVIEVRNIKKLAVVKAKRMITRIQEDLKKIFVGEYKRVVE
jgi:hypothetical protein